MLGGANGDTDPIDVLGVRFVGVSYDPAWKSAACPRRASGEGLDASDVSGWYKARGESHRAAYVSLDSPNDARGSAGFCVGSAL